MGYSAGGNYQILGNDHRECWRVLKRCEHSDSSHHHVLCLSTAFVKTCHDIKLTTKLWIYRTIIIPTLLHAMKYGCWGKLKSTRLTFLVLIIFVSFCALSGRRRSEMRLFIIKSSTHFHQYCFSFGGFLVQMYYWDERRMNYKAYLPRNTATWSAITWLSKALVVL